MYTMDLLSIYSFIFQVLALTIIRNDENFRNNEKYQQGML